MTGRRAAADARPDGVRGPLGHAWRGLTAVAAAGARPVLWWYRTSRNAGHARDLAQRLALSPEMDGLPRGGAWFHGASVGEVRALAPLVHAFTRLRPDIPVVVTSSTTAGRARAVEEVAPAARLAPLDAQGPVRRFLDGIAPRLHVIVETEIWPVRMALLRRRGVATALVSARLSPERESRYRRLASLYGPCLRGLALLAPASAEDRDRLLAIGADPHRLGPEGNLKWDAAPELPATASGDVAAALGLDPRTAWIVLGSVHPGEGFGIVESVRARLADPGAVGWLIAPRHPDRFEAEMALLGALPGGSWRASGGLAPAGARIVVLDRIGLLPRAYPLARAGVLGGTFVPVGGHTPLEAAAAGCPLVAGPHVDHQRDLVGPLEAAGAIVRCADMPAAADVLVRWVREPDAARAAGQAARREVEARRGIAARLAGRLAELVP